MGVVAVAVQPAYSLLRRRIERWVYGYRSDPAAALRRLSASVESADPLHVVDTITASVADALKVDRVWVDAYRADRSTPGTTGVPLVHRGDHIGDLVVEVPAGRTLSACRHRAAPRPRAARRGHRARGAARGGAAEPRGRGS